MSSPGQPTKLQLGMTWFAIVLTVILLVAGAFWYGLSWDVGKRFWSDIFGRLTGPMTFRLVLQPIMGLIAAIPDGRRDAREGHSAFFWTGRGDAAVRHGRLRQGLMATARIMLLGLSIDLIYQIKVFHQFYPAEAVLFSLILCVIPYFIWRWIVERIASWRGVRPHHDAMGSPDE